MKTSVIGSIVTVITLFIGLVIMLVYHLSIITWRDDIVTVQTETRNYIDKIIDTSINTEGYIEDYNLALASCSNIFTYSMEHYAKAVNPDGKGGTIANWTLVKDNTNFSKGDIVKIVVVQKSYNIFQKIASSLLGMQYVHKDISMAAMVR